MFFGWNGCEQRQIYRVLLQMKRHVMVNRQKSAVS